MTVEPKLTLLAIFYLPLCVAPLIILGKKVRHAVQNWTARQFRKPTCWLKRCQASA